MVWLLPEPDSPTIATVSPGVTSILMPLTACSTPSPVRKRTWRSRMERTDWAISAILRIEGVAQAVADEVEGEQDRDEGQRRIEQHPAGALDVLGALRDQDAEAGVRLLHPQPEER